MVLKQADRFFEEAKVFPGILGSFLFHRDLGLLKNHMPEVLKPADLDFLGKHLTQIHMSGQSGLGDVNEMGLCIADKHILVKMMGKTLFMIIACKSLPGDHITYENGGVRILLWFEFPDHWKNQFQIPGVFTGKPESFFYFSCWQVLSWSDKTKRHQQCRAGREYPSIYKGYF